MLLGEIEIYYIINESEPGISHSGELTEENQMTFEGSFQEFEIHPNYEFTLPIKRDTLDILHCIRIKLYLLSWSSYFKSC